MIELNYGCCTGIYNILCSLQVPVVFRILPSYPNVRLAYRKLLEGISQSFDAIKDQRICVRHYLSRISWLVLGVQTTLFQDTVLEETKVKAPIALLPDFLRDEANKLAAIT